MCDGLVIGMKSVAFSDGKPISQELTASVKVCVCMCEFVCMSVHALCVYVFKCTLVWVEHVCACARLYLAVIHFVL